MKIYEMNDTDWVCANSKEEALKVYSKHLKDCLGEVDKDIMENSDPIELTERQLDCLKFINIDNDELTFREELTKRQQPEFFASTEF